MAKRWCTVGPTYLTKVALESPTFAQKTLVPTIRTVTQVEPLNLKLIFESLVSVSWTLIKLLFSYSFTSAESTTLWATFAWSKVVLIPCSTYWARRVLTNSETSLPKTPWPSHTEKKCVLRYSPKCGMTKYASWLTLLGFFGLKPVFVANENLVTQLSNFFFWAGTGCYSGMGFEVVTSLVIEAR